MKKILLAILATAFVTAQAYAFSGTVAFDGTMTQTTVAGVTTNTFNNPWVTQNTNTGDYAVVPGGVSTMMTNFSFTGNNTLNPILIGGPIVPQWSFIFAGVTYSFDLVSLRAAVSNENGIIITGDGTAHIGGVSESAVWTLDGTGNNFEFSASIHTTALPAPDGGSAVALLGLALAGVEVLRRKLRIG